MAIKECSIEGCHRQAKTRGWCQAHYVRWFKTGDVRAHIPLAPRGAVCAVPECDQDASGGRGYCHMHYERVRRTGDPMPKPKAPPEPRMTTQGYMRVWTGEDYALEHRAVWERAHGPLLPGQNIHHRNGNRSDNRLSNLEVWDSSQPSGQRAADKVQYAVEMLNRYAPHLLAEQYEAVAS